MQTSDYLLYCEKVIRSAIFIKSNECYLCVCGIAKRDPNSLAVAYHF